MLMNFVPLDVDLITSTGLALLAGTTLRTSLLLGVVALAMLGLKRSSAALRHTVWMLALVSVLLLPILGWQLPSYQMPISFLAGVDLGTAEMVADSRPANQPLALDHEPGNWPAAESPLMTAMASQPPSTSPLDADPWIAGGQHVGRWLGSSLVMVWLIGGLLLLARLLLSWLLLWRLGRQSKQLEDERISQIFAAAACGLNLNRTIKLRAGCQQACPLTWGILSPHIWLPAEALQWREEQLRSVLLHELAHVRRRDCLSLLITQLTCALYWFNPLVWIAARQLHLESEQACDDIVLQQGVKASTYMEQLVAVAGRLRPSQLASLTSVSMASGARLMRRLKSIADDETDRDPTGARGFWLTAVMLLGFAIPLAAVQVIGVEQPATAQEVADSTGGRTAFDGGNNDDDAEALTATIRLKRLDANDVIGTIKRFYGGQMPLKVGHSISVDAKSNALILHATDEVIQQIETLVDALQGVRTGSRSLDEHAADAATASSASDPTDLSDRDSRRLRAYNVGRLAPRFFADMLLAVFAEQPDVRVRIDEDSRRVVVFATQSQLKTIDRLIKVLAENQRESELRDVFPSPGSVPESIPVDDAPIVEIVSASGTTRSTSATADQIRLVGSIAYTREHEDGRIAWLLVRSNDEQRVQIRPGQMLRVGRQTIVVSEIGERSLSLQSGGQQAQWQLGDSLEMCLHQLGASVGRDRD